jgi:drug/metabolite transporter (DMT)-like permease
MKRQNLTLGIILMTLTSLVFSLQDGISRYLADSYSIYMIVMVRFWFFAALVLVQAARAPGGLGAMVRTHYPKLQIFRSLLLCAEICIMVVAYIRLGLVDTHAVFTCYPLIVAALSGPVLGESVGWRRWTAIGIGFVGVLVILQPGVAAFSPDALLPLAAATMFALYGLFTRYVSRGDAAQVSFFWVSIVGLVVMTPLGLLHWTPMSATDWGWMALLCCLAASAHFMMIKALEIAEASAIQPFAYFQLVFVSILGVTIFDETLRTNVMIGAVLVVAAGLFTLWRARVKGAAV